MPRLNDLRHACAFSTRLGWMAITGCGTVVDQLTFGHASAAQALAALEAARIAEARIGRWNAPLMARLKAYAAGSRDDFLDISIAHGATTEFQAAVIDACRRIPHGNTLSYGELAVQAGAPGAARAVGNVMRRNRLPLIVPCHRVVASSSLGGYSAVDGLATKKRLLTLEAQQ